MLFRIPFYLNIKYVIQTIPKQTHLVAIPEKKAKHLFSVDTFSLKEIAPVYTNLVNITNPVEIIIELEYDKHGKSTAS